MKTFVYFLFIIFGGIVFIISRFHLHFGIIIEFISFFIMLAGLIPATIKWAKNNPREAKKDTKDPLS